MKYWVRVNKESLGPFTPEQIRQHPEVTEGTLVYPETAKSGADWKRLREVPELVQALRRPTAPPVARVSPPSITQRTPPAVRAVAATTSGPQSQPTSGSPLPTSLLTISWSKLALVGLAAAVLTAFVTVMNRRQRVVSDKVASSQQPPSDDATSKAVPASDPWAGKEQEAIAFAKNFPLRTFAFLRCPRNIEGIGDAVYDGEPPVSKYGIHADVTTWPRVKTISDVIECMRYLPAAITLIVTTQAQKAQGVFRGAEDVRRQVRANPEGFRHYAISVSQSWEARQESGPRYRVQVSIHEKGRKLMGPVDKATVWAWLVDLDKITLKPLTLAGWQNVDGRGAADWEEKQARGSLAETFDVSAVAPIYKASAPKDSRSGMEAGSP